MKLQSTLSKIQLALHVPKERTNHFGNFKYRSCDDILEAIKPHLAANNLCLVLKDRPLIVGGFLYIEATATLTTDDGGDVIESTAVAREPENALPKMSPGQTSGSTSSYARKYALNGLFLIDDSQDDDTRPPVEYPEKSPVTIMASAQQRIHIESLLHMFSDEQRGMFWDWLGSSLETLTDKQYETGISFLKSKLAD